MQQHGSKYFHVHPRPWGWGQSVKFQLFQNMFMLHIRLKGIMQCSNLVSKIFPADPPPPSRPWGMGSKVRNSTLSEYGHVAYQIKGNHDCSNMVANILPADPHPPSPVDWVNRSIFNFLEVTSPTPPRS